MAIAAVPAYLGQKFDSASPGLRFAMYLKLWGVDARSHQRLWTTYDLGEKESGHERRRREEKSENKRAALDAACALNDADRQLMDALRKRQAALATAIDPAQVLRSEAVAVAPFTTGLGNEHPLENGFAFLNPYGLPYLAGSGIKGVLRKAAGELADGSFGGTAGWTAAAIDALFGCASGQEDAGGGQRGALIVWDVLPQINAAKLQVEVMTPHQSHYLQGVEAPHESGKPNPINFMSVPPGSSFDFTVQCDLPFLDRHAPELVVDGRWKDLVHAALEHAFAWLGFGAKTAVGYGAMQLDPQIAARREAEAERAREAAAAAAREAERAAELASMTPVEREIRQCLDERTDPNLGEIPALLNALKKERWSGELKREIAGALRTRMQATKGKWKETTQAKKPEKDGDHQNTLQVMRWIAGD